MKAKPKPKSKPKSAVRAKGGPRRDLFAELSEGMRALAESRTGKRKLRTH